MFKFDLFNNPKPYEMYLCRPNEEIVCQLNGVDKSSATLNINLNNQYTLSFDYFKYISDCGEQIESNGFDLIAHGMKILVDRIGYFVVDYPEINFDGSLTTKIVNAFSCDKELENKDIIGFKVNTGEKDSLEYLVKYNDDETESLLNEYNGLPYDYIVFYNTFPQQLTDIHNKFSSNATITNSNDINILNNICKIIPRLKSKVVKNGETLSLVEYVIFEYDEYGNVSKIILNNFNERISELISFYTKYRKQLSLLDLAIEKCGCNWTIGEIDSSLVNKKFQFDEDGVNIYSFLTQNIASASNSVIWFDLFNKRINATLVDNIGHDSNVIIDRKNFVNSINISCDPSSICTRYNVSGDSGLGIDYVNFGTSRIDDISYFLNAKDSNGNLIYLSSSLAEKYKRFSDDREIARNYYIGNTKSYNEKIAEVSELKYRVPNDSVFNDWDTFSNDELDGELKVYNKLLVTLLSLYKNDYGESAVNSDGSINEDFIKTTEYWLDYYAYNQTIKQIEVAISQRANNNSYNDIKDDQLLREINAYKTEWSLYGTVELQNKIEVYNNNLSVLVDSEAVILRENSDEAKTWFELSSDEKGQYGNLEQNYQYDVYSSILSHKKSCQEYLDSLNEKLNDLVSISNIYQRDRVAIVGLVTLEGYNRTKLAEIVTLPNPQIDASFTEDEIRLINLLYIDKNYSNENIVKTSLDTAYTEVEIQYDLFNDAKDSLSIESQPQISFSANVDNFLCMPEFKDYDFNIGNFIVLEYDENYYVKLRISSIEFNPLIPTDNISVAFTNYIKSKSKRTDVSYILGNSSGGSSSSSSYSSGGGNGSSSFGDGIDITISNTMLSKLLNTEMFGSRVSDIILDTIQVNKISAKYAKFNGLAKGTTTIDGSCIQTGVIISNNYNGSKTIKSNGTIDFGIDNTTGSVIKIDDGTFNFGGGKLKFDGSLLSVSGEINAESGKFGTLYPFFIGENGIDGYSKYGSVISNSFSAGAKIDFTTGNFDDIIIDIFADENFDLEDVSLLLKNVTVFGRYTADYIFELSEEDQERLDNPGEDDVIVFHPMGSSTGDFEFPLETLNIDVKNDLTVHFDNLNKSYRYVFKKKYQNIRDDIFSHLSAEYEDDKDIISLTINVDYAFVRVYYSYTLNGVDMFTHIGTDYFDYSGLLTIKDGKVTLSNVLINDELHINGSIYMEDNNSIISGMIGTVGDKWAIGSMREDNLSSIEISSFADDSKPICARQYSKDGNKLKNTLILLDSDGNTTIPNTLLVNNVQSKSTSISVNSNTVKFNSVAVYVGDVDSSSVRRLRFKNKVGTNKHDCYIYGGNGDGTSGIGIYDAKHSRDVMYYKDDDNRLYINTGNFYFKDYSNTLRQPVSSIGGDGSRVSCISTTTAGVRVYGQWGVEGATFTYKTLTPSSSDIRLKENVGNCEVENALDIIDSIKLHAFDWKYNECNKHQKIGFIADELEKIDERLSIGGECDEDGNIGYKSVDTFYLIGYVVKALQELKKENERLYKVIKEKENEEVIN